MQQFLTIQKNNHLSDSEARIMGKNLPKIDINFIYEAIARYKKYGAVSECNQIYYFERRTNSSKQLNNYELNLTCKIHLNYVNSIEKAKSGSYSSHIEDIRTTWIELSDELKNQSYSLFKA